MSKPTEKEYQQALKDKTFLTDLLVMSSNERENLLNKLLKEQESFNEIKKDLEKANTIIIKYELHDEAEKEKEQTNGKK